MAETLREATVRTDPEFLSLGRDLKSLYQGAAELGKMVSNQLGSIRQSLTEVKVGGENGLTSQLWTALEANLKLAAEDGASLERMLGTLQRLRSQGGRIDRLARSLRASISCIAVESARSASCQLAFGAFVEDLRQLAQKISELGDSIAEQSESTHQKLQHITASISNDLDQVRGMAGSAKATLRRTAEEIQALLDASAAAVHEVEAHVRQIGGHADEAVYHLQFGDIVRQKMEHVVAALEDAGGAASAGDEESKARAAGILKVQAAQLEGIRGEVEAAAGKLARSFQSLKDEGELLGRSLERMGGFSSGSGQGGNGFGALVTSFDQLDLWQRQSRDLCSRANNLSSEATQDSKQLSTYLGRLEEINRDMHIQALNAIVKTALLRDEGLTLGVLSTHVHHVYLESNELVAETVGLLHSITGDAPSGSINSTRQSARSDTQSLRVLPEVIHQITNASASLIERQQRELAEAIERITFLTQLAADIGPMVEKCKELGQEIEPRTTIASPTTALKALDDRYTMASEREVHQRILRSGSQPETRPALVEEKPADNMEFFDFSDPGQAVTEPTKDLAAATTTGGPSPNSSKNPADDNIELF